MPKLNDIAEAQVYTIISAKNCINTLCLILLPHDTKYKSIIDKYQNLLNERFIKIISISEYEKIDENKLKELTIKFDYVVASLNNEIVNLINDYKNYNSSIPLFNEVKEYSKAIHLLKDIKLINKE